ncbi:MAG: recombinase family protein [Rickettsiales bacterium]|nr:recombinase family protein [Rickettsiales bacterium]MDG4548710.1 recombinase family protein [Rickettsiales bacterium]
MTNKKYIAYYRVSTDKQGKSGLGLEAQKQAVRQYLNGGQWELLEEFVEVESGKKNNRPKLQEAISVCKRMQATLIIAKLDRLARNVHFISGLMESGVDFIAVDNPQANKLMLHMLAAFAEHEREQISQRTKSALQAAKGRGVTLGSNGKALASQNKQAALDFALSLKSTIDEIRNRGVTTYRAIAEELNRLNIATFHGKGQWYAPAVHKLVKRLEG